MNQELKDKLIATIKGWDLLKGKRIKIEEYISTNGNNFDRHFTTSSNLEFVFKDFGVRFSGARIMFMGEKQSYEIGSDMVFKLDKVGENEYEVFEKYSDKVIRMSLLKFN